MKGFAAKAAFTLLLVMGAVAVGKWCQFAALAWLEPSLGFELASLAGLTPFVAILLFLSARYPRYFDFRHLWRRPAEPSRRR